MRYKIYKVLLLGLSRFNVGGSIFFSRDFNENTASTAPAHLISDQSLIYLNS